LTDIIRPLLDLPLLKRGMGFWFRFILVKDVQVGLKSLPAATARTGATGV